MRLITHNMLQCNVRGVVNGYPLHIETDPVNVKVIPAEFCKGAGYIYEYILRSPILPVCDGVGRIDPYFMVGLFLSFEKKMNFKIVHQHSLVTPKWAIETFHTTWMERCSYRCSIRSDRMGMKRSKSFYPFLLPILGVIH